jgi:hypothetical protein
VNLKEVLRRTSGLAAIRCGDDIVRLTDSRSRYAEAARAIAALDPDRIELLDREGAVLRVVSLHDDDGDDDGEGDAPQRDNMNVSDLASLARVLGDVADRAAMRHAQAYQAAFEAQTSLVRLIADRLGSLEKAWHRVIMTEYERAQTTTGDDGALDSLAQSVISLAAAKQGGAK